MHDDSLGAGIQVEFLVGHEFPVLADIYSNVTQFDTFAEGGNFIGAFGDEFLSHKTRESAVQNRLHNPRIVQLLGTVNFPASRHATSVVVVEELAIIAYRVTDIAIHDLHMENVIQKFEPFGADSFDKFDAPGNMVALVVRVCVFTIEQFHAKCDFAFLG